MKKIHYVHFGFPCTGTTWLYYNLVKHTEINSEDSKENGILHTEVNIDIQKYIDMYKEKDNSFNFNPTDFMLKNSMIKVLSTYITHSGASIRNPYELLQGWVNYLKYDGDLSAWIDKYIDDGYVDFATQIKKWKQYCDKPMLIMVMDDLVSDDQAYFDSLLDHLGLSRTVEVSHEKINWRKYLINLEFNQQQINKINGFIDDISSYMGRDFSHWKK